MIGWWLIPAFITIAAFGWAKWASGPDAYGTNDRLGTAIVAVFTLGPALVVSLSAWLVYFIIV